MESESNVRLPAVEVERVRGMARVTLRRNYEEYIRDDEGAMWRWDELSLETPMVDGLEDVVAADFDAWWSHAERIAEMRARAEADERAVEAAVAALETPMVDGLEDVVAADFDAWWSHAERIAEMRARAEADERAVEAAVAALPVYQEENDMAVLELGDLTAGAESHISAVEVAIMEIGDMIGGGA